MGLWIDAFVPATQLAWVRSGPHRSPGGGCPTRCPHGPRALGRQRFSALSGSEDPAAAAPEGSATAGAARSQPEGCCASSPPDTPPSKEQRCRMVVGPLARPEDRTVAPPPVMPPKGNPTTKTPVPKNRRPYRRRCTRRCLDSGRPPAPPEGGPDDLPCPAPWLLHPEVEHRFRACPVARHLIPEGTVHRGGWAARRRTHTRRCAPQRATRIPVGDTKHFRAFDPKADRAERAGTPKGPAVASDHAVSLRTGPFEGTGPDRSF